jgi:hypothetical protein
MNKCRSCGLVIEDQGTAEHRQWCGSMRRILIIKTVQPENYHRHCFVNSAVVEDTSVARAGASGTVPLAAHAFDFTHFAEVAFPPSWAYSKPL